MNTLLEYLLSYLEEEFRGVKEVRIHLTPKAIKQKSPDLEQDFKESFESETDTFSRGVVVRTKRREYFFPEVWVSEKRFSEITRLAVEIKDSLDRS